MPRVSHVKKCRKAQGTCGKCGKEIKKGDPYRHWKFRYGGKYKRCMESACAPRASDLTQSDKLGQVYDAQDELEQTLGSWDGQDLSDIQAAVETAAEAFRQVGEEYRESKENMPEGLQEGAVGQQCEENADNLDGWADELDSLSLEEFEHEDEICDECEGAGEIDCDDCDPSEETEEGDECGTCQDARSITCPECEGEKPDADAETKREEAREEWAQQIKDEVEGVLGNCPL